MGPSAADPAAAAVALSDATTTSQSPFLPSLVNPRRPTVSANRRNLRSGAVVKGVGCMESAPRTTDRVRSASPFER